jgi:hypothetical protein
MSRRLTRRAITALAATAALLTAAFAAAPQADASTIYACVKKKSGTARFVSQKTKCRKSETRMSWNTSGTSGKNGANGLAGSQGAAGKEGKEGAPGKDVPTVLAAGKSERGYYAAWGIGGGYLGTAITYQVPLSAPLDATHVHFVKTGTTVPACTGDAATPTAASGNLCVYETSSGGATFGNIFPQSTGGGTGSDLDGFGIWFIATGSTGDWTYGSWAVTG